VRALSNLLYRLSSWRSIVLSIVIYGWFLSQVMAPQADAMQAFAGDWGSPDGHFYYTPDELYAHLSTWSAAGQQQYIDFRLSLDPVWALVYSLFLITVLSVTLRMLYPRDAPQRLLNLIPLLPMLADIAENFMGIAVIHNLPQRLDVLAGLTAATTTFKWTTLALAHGLMLLCIICAAWQSIHRRRHSP